MDARIEEYDYIHYVLDNQEEKQGEVLPLRISRAEIVARPALLSDPVTDRKRDGKWFRRRLRYRGYLP